MSDEKRLSINVSTLTHAKLQVLSKMDRRPMQRYLEQQIIETYAGLFGDQSPKEVLANWKTSESAL
jgi:hypothetical protein